MSSFSNMVRRAAVAIPTAVAIAGAAVAPADAAAMPVDVRTAALKPVVLDALPPLDVAAHGDALAWLRPVPIAGEAKVTDSVLVIRDRPGESPRALSVSVPKGARNLTLGTDGQGRLTVVLAGRDGLYALPADGTAAPARIAGTRRTDGHPGLDDGRLSFVRHERIAGQRRATVRLGSMAAGTSRVVWAGAPHTTVEDTAVGAGPTVVFETFRGTSHGSVEYLRAVRPGHRSRKLLRQANGEAAPAGLGKATISADRTQVSATRWAEEDHANDLTAFGLPGGRRLSRSPLSNLGGGYVELPLQSGARAAFAVTGLDCSIPNEANPDWVSDPCHLYLVQ